jgi:hypothetical protein
MVLQIYKTAGNGRPELRALSLCHEILQSSETSRNDRVAADLTMSAAKRTDNLRAAASFCLVVDG